LNLNRSLSFLQLGLLEAEELLLLGAAQSKGMWEVLFRPLQSTQAEKRRREKSLPEEDPKFEL
jgi:hypothetical protein